MSFGNASTFNPLFSEGANNAIQALHPHGGNSGKVVFPPKQEDEESLRVGKSETLHQWFKRVIGPDEVADSKIDQCAIRDDCVFFGRVAWDADGINYCSLQALVTRGCSLSDYYLADECSGHKIHAYYYRLDLDLRMPGPLFKEAMPHVHCIPDGPPRFPFNGSEEYLPISFLEFIYLNHFHDDWLKWARSEVSKRKPGLPLDGIVEGYNSGSVVQRIAQYRLHLAELKELLFNAKRSRVPSAPQPNKCVADLNYFAPKI